jgi:hypothetical protein
MGRFKDDWGLLKQQNYFNQTPFKIFRRRRIKKE